MARDFVADRVTVNVQLDPWLDLSGAARYASLSRRTLARAIGRRTNPLPVERVGGKHLMKMSDLDTWIRREGARAEGSAVALAEADIEALRAVENGRI